LGVEILLDLIEKANRIVWKPADVSCQLRVLTDSLAGLCPARRGSNALEVNGIDLLFCGCGVKRFCDLVDALPDIGHDTLCRLAYSGTDC
jgi:hypothetical protein